MSWPDAPAATLIPRPGSILPEDPRNAEWRALLPAAAALVEATGSVVRFVDLTAGGGSMLAARYGHRRSRDLDLFLPDPQLLGALSPRLNAAAAALPEDYEESSNFLKLRFGEREIDVVVAAPVLPRRGADRLDLGAGRWIAVEPPGEIIAKKLLYRAGGFAQRDAFDLATVASLEPAELADVARHVGMRALTRVAERLRLLAAERPQDAPARLAPHPGFAGLVVEFHAIAAATVARMRAELGDIRGPAG